MNKRNKKKLHVAKEAAFQRALALRDALIHELKNQNAENQERTDYLSKLVILLQETLQNLQADLGPGLITSSRS